MGKDGFYFKMVWIILLFSGFVSCNDTGTKIDQSAESFKIYRLLIDRFYIEKENQPVVINQISSLPGVSISSMNFIFFSPRINKDTLINFNKENQISRKIGADFPVDSKHIFVALNFGGDDFEDRCKNRQTYNSCMKRLKKLYPDFGGIIIFSKIGFNKEVNQGLVTFYIDRWTSQITSGIIFLEKKKGPFPHVWSIEKTEVDEYQS
jgi:hypothetical protein